MSKSDRRILCEVTNMILIKNKTDEKFVAILRELSWRGLSLPGGHVEPGESFYASAVREAYEETGLTVRKLRLSAIVNWCKKNTNDRYIVYVYVTSDYDGTLKDRTEEGRVFFTSLREIEDGAYPLCNGIIDYIKAALSDEMTELSVIYDEQSEDQEIIQC